MAPERRAFYIDGFNLYYGLKAKGWRKYYWLNLEEMCFRLTKLGQELVKIRYFTARISGNQKRKRQQTYLEALDTLPKLETHYGLYLPGKQICRKCKCVSSKPSEKKSDVNIAIRMLTDALDDLYDVAVLISADSDLIPAIEAIKTYAPSKRVGLLFPPERNSALLQAECHFHIGTLNEGTLRKSQFPDVVISRSGFPLHRPQHWAAITKAISPKVSP
jgi:uncharacterized LabA/DUF88 family protein